MIQWLLEKIGIENDITSRLEYAEWSLSHPLSLWLGLAILVPVGWFIFNRHRRNLPQVSRLFRFTLSTCRVSVLALLIFVLAGPQIHVREPAKQKPILAFLLDESESMDLPAGPYSSDLAAPLANAIGLLDGASGDEKTTLPDEARRQLDSMPRRELLSRILRKNGPALKELEKRFEVRSYRFAQSVVRSTLDSFGQSGDATTENALGQTTAIGSALKLAVDEASGQPIAGVIILSDGRVTSGPNPQHLVGEDGEAGGIPIWSIPVGSRRGLNDVSLLGVITPQNIALGDPIEITATVRAHGFNRVPAVVELLDGDNTVDRSQFVLGSGEEQSVKLRYQTDRPGTHLLTVRVDQKPGEIVVRNNEQQVALQVDQQQWRVLYLEGWPRWDFRFLDHAFRRDHGLDVRMVMESQLVEKRRQLAEAKKESKNGGSASADDGGQSEEATESMPPLTALAELPDSVAGLSEYDVVVLGDVSPELLTPKIQQALVRAVKEHGLGLILQAGTQHLPHTYHEQPLGELVPLVVPAAGVGQGGMRAEAFSPFTLSITDDGYLYPAFRPYDQLANNREIWGRMPALYWAIDATESSTAVRIMAEVKTLNGLQPLIAERYFGKGRVFLIGTDSTYRWKKNIGDQLFYPFWGRTIRQLAESRNRQSEQSWIEATPRRSELGEAINVELYIAGSDHNPLTDEKIDVVIKAASGEEPEILSVGYVGEPGWYRAVWRPSRLGDFQLDYTDPSGNTTSTEVRVAASGREFLHPSADWQSLGQLAEASNGGALLPLHEFARLTTLVQGNATDIVRDFEAQLWDNWLVLSLLAGLYCLDIVIRRLLSLT